MSILQDFLIAIVWESESNLGCGVADLQEGKTPCWLVPYQPRV